MEEEANNKKDRRRALIGTFLFHAALIVLFLFFGLQEPHPPREEQMVSIDMDFGTDVQGQGDREAPQEETEEPTNAESDQTETEDQQSADQSPDVATQEDSDVDVKEDEEEETEDGDDDAEEEEEEREENEERQEAMDQFRNMEDSGGDGDDEESGNEGDPSGEPEGEGNLGGAGGSWKLSGREILRKPQPEKPNEEGRVVLDIWVDRQGNVVRSSLNMSKSNTTSNQLVELATDAAKEAKFNPDPDGSAQQKGTFTFVFELR